MTENSKYDIILHSNFTATLTQILDIRVFAKTKFNLVFLNIQEFRQIQFKYSWIRNPEKKILNSVKNEIQEFSCPENNRSWKI